MSTPKDGGAAFPLQEHGEARSVPGMSLLDWFAGQALAGVLSDPTQRDRPENFAKMAYDFAEAMIAERERRAK